LSLLHGRGGPNDFQLAHQELEHLTYNEDTPKDIKGLSYSALADSYRTGRGVDQSSDKARTLYQQAAEHGYAGAALNLGLYYENLWQEPVTDESLPDLSEAARYYRMGASKDPQCASRFEQVRVRRKN
jgi:TPR repeat protein